MNDKELLDALRRVDPSDHHCCLGCGYEHSCAIHGCAVHNAAAERIRTLLAEAAALRAQPLGGEAATGLSHASRGPRQEPVKLDRSGWERCTWCKTYGFGAVVFDEQKYCGYCGHPLTEEAWAELERRIGGNDGQADSYDA